MSRFAPLETRRDVWLNDLPFSHVDELGNRWIISDIDGWWDLPPMTMGEVDRAYSEDGSYYEPGRYSSRAIRLTGKIIPPNNNGNAANLARQALNQRLMLVRKTGLLQVLESPELGGGKQSEVVVIARPLMKADRLNGVIDFDIQFRAPDPRKYSVTLQTVEAFLRGGDTKLGRSYGLVYNRTYVGAQSANTALVVNNGDYDTYGVIRLHGPVDSPGAHHLDTDRHIRFPEVRLGVGQHLDINLGEKTIITESGISLRDRMDDSSRWFKFDAGENKVALLGTSYLEPVPGVPDVKNLVTDPSFEGTSDNGTVRTVRSNVAPNPSGNTDAVEIIVRESSFDDPNGTDPTRYSGGTVSNGRIQSPNITLVYGADPTFPADGSHYFVQTQLRPVNGNVPTARITMGTRTSGNVALTAGTWTTVRVDSYIPDESIDISIALPGASTSSYVEVRNTMVLRSPTPIAGEIPFWSPVVGSTYEGVQTHALTNGEYRQSIVEPIGWTMPNNPEAKLRIIGEDTYLIPANAEDHVVDFGEATRLGTDITYGVLGEGITEVRLYDSDTGSLLQTSAPSHVANNYISDVAIRPRVEATFSVASGDNYVRRLISGVMITYDGGQKIFTDLTPDEDGYMYDFYSDTVPARERVVSFVTDAFPSGYHTHAREVTHRAFEGSRSLEITYNITPDDDEDVPATPITRPILSFTPGTHYVRAKIMSNKPTTINVVVEGIQEPISHTIGANPNHWSDVSFPVELQTVDNPYITVTPSAGSRDLGIYVDAVGLMTDDYPYFDGSTRGPYTWTGAPHASSSATIPVVGVPAPRMEIMYRNAWIG